MKKIWHASLCSLGFALLPAQANENPDNIRLGDVLNILLGAYNGAADVAEQRGHPFAERLSAEDAARLERGLNHLQQELQGVVRADGTLDSQRAAQLLNDLQQLRGGQPTFDFVQAEEALRRAERNGNLTLEGVLGAVVGAGNAALSAEVAELKALADAQMGTAAYRGDSVLVDLLKLVYADRELNSVDPAREEKAHRLVADVLARGQVSEARYEEIRKLLDAIGRPFKEDYKAWERGRGKIVRRELKTQEMQDVIGVLQNKDLTPEQREQILRALNPNKK